MDGWVDLRHSHLMTWTQGPFELPPTGQSSVPNSLPISFAKLELVLPSSSAWFYLSVLSACERDALYPFYR